MHADEKKVVVERWSPTRRASALYRNAPGRRPALPLRSLARPNRPLAVDHARRHIALMVQHALVNVRKLSREWNCDKIGKRAFGKLSNLSDPPERTRAIDGGHLQNGFFGYARMPGGEGAHFLEHVQFHGLFSGLEDGGQAVGAKAEVHAGPAEFVVREFGVLKISMAPRAMNDADFFSL